jgi:hypothetical protein
MSIAVPRVFVLGATTLQDPCPNGSLADSIRVLSRTYPQFRESKIYDEDGVMDKGNLTYQLKLSPAKTNG